MTIDVSGKNWKNYVRAAAVEIDTKFPRPDWTSTYPGHGENSAVGAYAVDFMIPSKALGDKIAEYAWENRVRLGIWYVIWNKRIISRTPGKGYWKTYVNPVPSRRGTASGDHTNHVHASFYTSVPEGYKPVVTPVEVPPVVTPAPSPVEPSAPVQKYPTPKSKVVYIDRLSPGVKDSDSVWWLQKALGIVTTGTYDARTVAAVKKYQKTLGDTEQDGDIGPLQTRALFKARKSLGVTVEDKS